MKEINIRQYKKSDKELLKNILRANIPHYFSPEEEADFVEYIDIHIEQYFVAEYNNTIVGCGGLNFFEDHVKISWDMIHPDYQGKGIGGLLLTHRINKIKEEANVKKIIVRTSQLVYPFYEKHGFSLIEVQPDYWAVGYDLYKLQLTII